MFEERLGMTGPKVTKRGCETLMTLMTLVTLVTLVTLRLQAEPQIPDCSRI